MQKTYKYKAFISYAHKDKAFASWLHRGIENYTIPTALRKKYSQLPTDLKRTLFRDEEELSSATSLPEALKVALADSQYLIVICSTSSVASKWVEEEIAYFKNLHVDAKIIVVLKEGEAKEVIPSVLFEETEPLAIDVSRKDKKALVKVIASVLDVDFSDLWQREKREMRKRTLWKFAIVSLVFALFGYVLMQSNAISSNAKLESINNEIQTIEYTLKHRKMDEEALYRFSIRLKELQDTKKVKIDTLKWFGLLKTSVAKKAKEAYDKKGADEALAILESVKSLKEDEVYAKKNMLRAKLYIEKDDYERAGVFYSKAVAVDDGYENLYEYILFLMQQHHFEEARTFLERLSTKELTPQEKANVYNRLGIVYREAEAYTKAKEAYAVALVLRKDLAKQNPKKYSNDLAWTYNNLGVLYNESHQDEASRSAHLKAFALRKALMKEDPEKYTPYVSCSMHNLGELYYDMEQATEAERFFEDAISIRRKLVKKNPKRYTKALATSLHELATLYVKRDELKKAENLYKEALAYRKTLATYNPEAHTEALKETEEALQQLQKRLSDAT